MQKGFLSSLSPGAKIVFSIIIALFSMFVVNILGTLVAIIFFEMSFTDLQETIRNFDLDNISLLKFYQILQTLGLFVIPALFLARLFFKRGLSVFFQNHRPYRSDFMWVAVIIFFGIPIISLLGQWNSAFSLPSFLSGFESQLKAMEERAELLTTAFLSTRSTSGLLVNILMIAVLPAIGEELFFRGIIQQLFIEWTKKAWLGILLSSFLFSFLHFQFYGFVPRFYLGVVFGFVYLWTGSIWLPITAHFLNNVVAVLAYYFYDKEMTGAGIEMYSEFATFLRIFIGALVVILALWQIYSRNNFKPDPSLGEKN